MGQFEAILQDNSALPREYVPTANSLFRILAEPLKARTSLPEFDISALDGYAVRHADMEHLPAALTVIGKSSSAKPFAGIPASGEAVKIYAGGRMPQGTDCVAAHSLVKEEGDGIIISHPPVPGENICPAGVDFNITEETIPAGVIMTARLVGLASTMHVMWVPVVRKPRVAVLAVGNELAMPGEANAASPITASSLYSFSADIIAAGGDPVILGIAGDSVASVTEKIANASGCDLLLTTGATSAAAGHLMQTALSDLCSNTQKLTVELNRNDYMLYAKLGSMPVCALPGNPISSKIYFTLFVDPLIGRLVGMNPPGKTYAILGRNVDTHDTSVAYLHASLSIDKSGSYQVIPVSAQDGFLLSELAKAHCLMVVNQNKTLKKGDFVEVIPYARPMS